MATVNSQTIKGTVIRTGEQLSTTVEASKDPKAKTYRSMVPGSKFIMPDGLVINFMGGQFSTSDPEIIAELDLVANKASSAIYTDDIAAKAQAAQIAAVAKDAGGEQVAESK